MIDTRKKAVAAKPTISELLKYLNNKDIRTAVARYLSKHGDDSLNSLTLIPRVKTKEERD